MQATTEAALTAVDLTKSFGQVRAVSGLSFSVPVAAVTGFVGPNGAGKSTTLRMALGLVRPDSGEVRIWGHRYRDLVNPAREVGAVLESPGANPGFRGRDHLSAVAATAGIRPGKRVRESLELVGLSSAANRRVRTYSLGMRQRLAIAAALLAEPRLLILDEPTNGLDPAGIRWLRGLLRERAARGCAVLVSSHQLSELEQLADHVVLIDKGRLIAAKPLSQLVHQSRRLIRVRCADQQGLARALQERGAATELLGSDTVIVPDGDPAMVAETALEARIAVTELTNMVDTLEDSVLALLREPPAQSADPAGNDGEK